MLQPRGGLHHGCSTWSAFGAQRCETEAESQPHDPAQEGQQCAWQHARGAEPSQEDGRQEARRQEDSRTALIHLVLVRQSQGAAHRQPRLFQNAHAHASITLD